MLEVEKPKAAQEKLIAAALGDRSENADYQAAKDMGDRAAAGAAKADYEARKDEL